MKSGLSHTLLLLAILSVISFNYVQAQNDLPDSLVKKMLRDFYTSYMKQFTDLSPGHEQKTKEILKKYCTAGLIKKIPKLADKTDSDPFLMAQDSDSSWTKSLVIKKDLKKSGVYVVSYHDDSEAKTFVIIHLLVVRQKESYLISDVW
ncbi:MAG TPA: hypothetical protein VFI33_15130 [Puia sp.]|nr:hypothetical protein [Puia sp.]